MVVDNIYQKNKERWNKKVGEILQLFNQRQVILTLNT